MTQAHPGEDGPVLVERGPESVTADEDAEGIHREFQPRLRRVLGSRASHIGNYQMDRGEDRCQA